MKKTMIRTASLVLSVVLICFSVCGCNSNNEERKNAIEIYDKLTEGYNITDKIGSDIYEAWRGGAEDTDAILASPIEKMSEKLNLSKSDIENGYLSIAVEAAVTYNKENDFNYETLTDEQRNNILNAASIAFSIYKDDLYDFTVAVVQRAYELNGKYNDIKSIIEEADDIIKQFKESYPDSEYNTDLEKFYDSVNTFYEYCISPQGSTLDQLKTSFDEYRQSIEDCQSKLSVVAQ